MGGHLMGLLILNGLLSVINNALTVVWGITPPMQSDTSVWVTLPITYNVYYGVWLQRQNATNNYTPTPYDRYPSQIRIMNNGTSIANTKIYFICTGV